MRFFLLVTLALIACPSLYSQQSNEEVIRSIFDDALMSLESYHNLEYLCNETPGRLLGTKASLLALDYFRDYFHKLGADTVFLQEFKTPAWKHLSTSVEMIEGGQKTRFRAVALGPSPSTPAGGILREVIEVMGLEELKRLDPELVRDKIVFFNRPVDYTLFNTFRAYGSAVDQRIHGPALAASMGAAGVLVRSVTTARDTIPHSGSTRFDSLRAPCAAISQVDADILTQMLKENRSTQINMNIQAEDLEEITSFNLVADLKGSQFPDEYIIVGGHIDSWYNTPGAHDDGAGCAQSADVMRIFKSLDLQNKRTIRVVLFMDEELFQSGGDAWARYTDENHLNTYLAMEADAGAFAPDGFMVDASDTVYHVIAGFKPWLEPYGIHFIKKGGSGVDIHPLKELGIPLMGYRTDTQRYMDIHHSAADTMDKVSLRELQLGSGCMAAMIYLADRHGIYQ